MYKIRISLNGISIFARDLHFLVNGIVHFEWSHSVLTEPFGAPSFSFRYFIFRIPTSFLPLKPSSFSNGFTVPLLRANQIVTSVTPTFLIVNSTVFKSSSIDKPLGRLHFLLIISKSQHFFDWPLSTLSMHFLSLSGFWPLWFFPWLRLRLLHHFSAGGTQFWESLVENRLYLCWQRWSRWISPELPLDYSFGPFVSRTMIRPSIFLLGRPTFFSVLRR